MPIIVWLTCNVQSVRMLRGAWYVRSRLNVRSLLPVGKFGGCPVDNMQAEFK